MPALLAARPELAAPGCHREFLLGVATSPYQVEGGFNGPNQPQNNWTWWEHEGHVEPTGRAAGFITRYREDFARARALGLNAFRLGLDWSRLQPVRAMPAQQTGEQLAPVFDSAALDAYAEIVQSCREAGLEPVVTLHHFVHPAWLGVEAWDDERTPERFAAWVDFAVGGLLDRLKTPADAPRLYTTVNEPNMLMVCSCLSRAFPHGAAPSFGRASRWMANLLRAHALAYDVVHRRYRLNGLASPLLTFNTYASDLYWIDGALTDLFLAPAQGVERKDIFKWLRHRAAAFEKSLAAERVAPPAGWRNTAAAMLRLAQHAAACWASGHPAWGKLLDVLYDRPQPVRRLDALGLDYYEPFAANLIRAPRWDDFDKRPRGLRDLLVESVIAKWWDWRHSPDGLAFFVRHHAAANLPILIAENGMAERHEDGAAGPARPDGLTRSDFLRLHLRAITDLAAAGLPLIGYLHWSLTDNYEWGSYSPRFGLYRVDCARSTERRPRRDPSGEDPAAVMAEEIRRARSRLQGLPLWRHE